MAKWSFLLVALSLGLALAITPETQRIYRDPRTLIVFAGAALPMLPFLLWLANLDPDLISRRAVPRGNGLSAALSLEGALVFVTGIPLVFLPWIAFVLFFAWRFPEDTVAAGEASGSGDQARGPHGAEVTLAIMAALLLFAMATGSALFGITPPRRGRCPRVRGSSRRP